MTPNRILLNLETLRPRLVAGVIFIDAGPSHLFLKNAANAAYVKLTKKEATIIRMFDGTWTLPDILQEQIEESGTEYFQNTLDAIEKLNNGGFLADGPAASVLPSATRTASRGRFNNTILQFFAAALMSVPGLVFLVLCGAAGWLLPMAVQRGNILQAFTVLPTAGEPQRLLSYGGGLGVLWLTLALVITIKNLLSAFALSYDQCEILRPQLRFRYGLAFFECGLDDIVSAGTTVVSRLFLMRMLFPLLFMPAGVVLSYYLTFPEIVRQACWFAFLFGISPLMESDLTQYLYYVTEFGASGRPLNRFLRKKFLRGLFCNTVDNHAQEYFLGMSAAALLWLYFVYSALWGILLAGFSGLAADFMAGSVLMKTLTGIYFVILTLPLVVVLAVILSIGLSNAVEVSGSPLRRIVQLGRKIARGSVPAQGDLVAFLQGIPLFSKLDENELEVLTSRLRIVRLRPGATAIVQGDQGDAFYCVVSGKLHVIIEDEYCQERLVNELEPGGSFGEIALLESVPRTATVVAVEPSTLIELGRKEFEEFVVRSAGGGEKVTDLIRIGKMLMNSGGLFSSLAPCQINRLVAMLKREVYAAGDVIFHQGEPGDRFYIIDKGEVFVDYLDARGTPCRLILGKGEFFGEIALIKNMPRTATLTAAEDVELLYLTKNEFYDFLRHNAWVGVQFDEIVNRRIAGIENGCVVSSRKEVSD
ncbi:membrane hypothetical protein [Gammaproteobacteria bacterium]